MQNILKTQSYQSNFLNSPDSSRLPTVDTSSAFDAIIKFTPPIFLYRFAGGPDPFTRPTDVDKRRQPSVSRSEPGTGGHGQRGHVLRAVRRRAFSDERRLPADAGQRPANGAHRHGVRENELQRSLLADEDGHRHIIQIRRARRLPAHVQKNVPQSDRITFLQKGKRRLSFAVEPKT